MRMRIIHTDIKKIYDRYGRKWFHTYSLFNFYDQSNGASVLDENLYTKYLLASMVEKSYIIRENGTKIKYSDEWSDYPTDMKMKERWRLSGKAFLELYDVLDECDIEIIDQDYADMSKVALIT